MDPKIDLQTAHVFEYLEETVGELVLQGLLAVAEERPEEPIEYLAVYLMKNKPIPEFPPHHY